MRSILFISFIQLISALLSAQSDVVSFRHYGVADGLSDNTIRCLYFDSQGFLWIGTNEGLNRFDGEEFFHYKKGSGGKYSLCGNVITDVIEDENANLWIATRDGGICHMDRNTGAMKFPVLFNDSSKVNVQLVHRLRFDNKGLLYVCSDKGLFVSDSTCTEFKLATYNRLGAFYDAIPGKDGILIGSISRGISKLVGDSMISAITPTSAVGSTPNQLIRDSDGRIWCGAWDHHIHSLDEAAHTIQSFDFMNSGTTDYLGEEIYCLTEARPHELWLGMRSGTLWKFNTQSLTGSAIEVNSQETARLNGNRIYCIITDPHGRTWVGTDAGLHVHNPFNSKFDVRWIGNTRAAVNDFLQQDEKLWIATNDGLLVNESGKLNNAPVFAAGSVQAHSLMLDSSNTLWVGTDNIVQKLDVQRGLFQVPHPKHPAMGNNYWVSTRVNSLAVANLEGNDYLLYNTYGHGTIVCDTEQKRWALFYAYINGAVDNLVKKLKVDSRGRLWIVGSIMGIGLFEKFQSFDEDRPALTWIYEDNVKISPARLVCKGFLQAGISHDATAMMENADGTFWVGTQGSGLLYFEPEKDSMWFTPVKNSPLSVKSLERDARGVLWMNASGGLYSFNPGTGEWKRYDEKDGIPAAGLSNALFMHENGEALVGGNGFYITFDPNVKMENNELPRTIITHLDVLDHRSDSLLRQQTVSFFSEQNFLTFHFTSLCFNNAENCTFQYMLQGLDDDWRDNNTLNFVSYNKLPFGQYTFKVRSFNSDGVMDQSEAQFSFTIRAPFYFRWWFVVLMVLLVASIAAAILRYRQQQKLKLEKVRNKIARDLHDDVGSALGSISYFSATAKKSLDENNLDTSKMVLEKIGSTSREMIENMHDIVWAVNPENDSFDHVMERMKSHAADIASANNIKLVFEADEKLNSLKLSMTERKNLFLIFKESLYNSLKYSECDTIEISLKAKSGSSLVMKITDNGKGFDVEKRMGKGNGLKNMKVRAEEMGAKFSIKTAMKEGTVVEVLMLSFHY